MKRFWFWIAVMSLFVSVVSAEVLYYGTLVNKAGIDQATSYSLDLLNSNGQNDKLSMQAVYNTSKYASVLISTTNVNTTSSQITSTQSYTAGYSVLFASQSFSFVGLWNNTTYYVVPLTSTLIELATTQAQALSGQYVTISAGAMNPKGTFTLTPVDVQPGSPFGIIWQASNDNTNWYAMSVTSITISTTTAKTNYLWDFGFVNFQYIRANVITGVYGSIDLVIKGIGKHN